MSSRRKELKLKKTPAKIEQTTRSAGESTSTSSYSAMQTALPLPESTTPNSPVPTITLSTTAIIGIVCGVVGLFLFFALGYIFVRKRRRPRSTGSSAQSEVSPNSSLSKRDAAIYSYPEKAFSNQIAADTAHFSSSEMDGNALVAYKQALERMSSLYTAEPSDTSVRVDRDVAYGIEDRASSQSSISASAIYEQYYKNNSVEPVQISTLMQAINETPAQSPNLRLRDSMYTFAPSSEGKGSAPSNSKLSEAAGTEMRKTVSDGDAIQKRSPSQTQRHSEPVKSKFPSFAKIVTDSLAVDTLELVVIQDHSSSTKEEMNLKVGDLVALIQKVDEQVGFGVNRTSNDLGFFPLIKTKSAREE